MKLQDQVCTLEQAKRLKELGVRQDVSHAAWLRNECHGETEFWCWPVEAQGISNRGYSSPRNGCLEGFSAFTVAELGMMLPHPDGMFELGGFNHPSDFDPTAKDGKPWYCMWEYDTDKYGMKRQLFEGATEAEARAAILIYFLEINLIQSEEVNARLCA
jgi:hypothetical protein